MQVPVLAELKRRRVFRALVGYGIAAFAVLQIIEPVMHGLHWPDAVLSYVVVGLAVGFPVVVTLAWIFDVNAGRIERTPPPAQMKPAKVALLLAGIGALAAAPGLAWYFLIHPRVTAGAARSDHSIAVLPFASLSAGEENKNFADAIHIELLSQLAKIGDLKVISRTSVLQYREGPKNVREIAEALGVSSVLEGSVQREGNRVRVQAQLIDAVGDREIWAERYDRELTDLFLIQTSIAEEISKALHARLLPEERSRIARRPTGNPDAYDAYLSAWELVNRAHLQRLPAAELLYRRALGLDPDFALAWARLSFLHSTMYWFNLDHSKARLAQAREAADRALALQPDLPEAHAALGIFHYWSGRDYQRALDEFRTALRSDPYVREYIAYVQRRQGRFDEALANLEQAAALDPRNRRISIGRVNTLIFLRRYEDATVLLQRLRALAPDFPAARHFQAYLAILSRGDVGPVRGVVDELLAAERTEGPEAWNSPILSELMDYAPQEALAALPGAPAVLPGASLYRPRSLLLAMAEEARGNGPQARAQYQAALAELKVAVENDPDDALRRSALALAHAGLGHRDEALREARHGAEIVPVAKDAFLGPVLLEQLAAVEARFGQADEAVALLGKLLTIPGRLSPAALRIDPKFRPLHGDPRFQRLTATARL